MNNRTIPLLLGFGAVLVMLHQWLYWGVWFEIKDLHHETVIIAFLFAALLLIYVRRRRNQ